MDEILDADRFLLERISEGESQAWEALIARYEGRLLAFAEQRVRNRATAEDIVQETFIGFLNSLPNYDRRRPLEGYLFTICAHKLTDHLRREGRRPALTMSQSPAGSDETAWEIAAPQARPASSIVRSGERRGLEDHAVAMAIAEQVNKWRAGGDWLKLKCIELAFLTGLGNKQIAERLQITEQQVANFKSDFLNRTKKLISRQHLNTDVFPELQL